MYKTIAILIALFGLVACRYFGSSSWLRRGRRAACGRRGCRSADDSAGY
jgi:hypothetical protein